MKRAGLVVLLLIASPGVARTASSVANLRDWTLARCIARAAGDAPFAADARRSAAALLERGTAGAEIYERIDALVAKTLAVPVSGSSGGTYAVLQCIDLTHSKALAQVIDGRRR